LYITPRYLELPCLEGYTHGQSAMTTLVDCPESRSGDWAFRLFRIQVRVKFWFWIATVLLSGTGDAKALMIWMAVCFVSILLHEFGHVWAFRLFGTDAETVLYGWGGLAIPDRCPRGRLATFVVSLAGPVAGFCLAALAFAVARSVGAVIQWRFYMFLPSISAWPATPTPASYYWYVLLNDVLHVNFYWGLINLLPVYPLDGGQAARALFEQRNPYRGRRHSLICSAAVAGAIALSGVILGSTFRLIVFGVLAVSSLQALETVRDRVPRPYRSTR
jgi:stage IV sporulation protein FB